VKSSDLRVLSNGLHVWNCLNLQRRKPGLALFAARCRPPDLEDFL